MKFSIVKVIDNTNRTNIIYSEVGDELSNLKNDNIQSKVQRINKSDSVTKTTDTRRDKQQ